MPRSSEEETALVVHLVHLVTSWWTLVLCAVLLAALVGVLVWDTFGRPPWGERGGRVLVGCSLFVYPLILALLCAFLFFRLW